MKRPPDADLQAAAEWLESYDGGPGDDLGPRLAGVAAWIEATVAAGREERSVRAAVRMYGVKPAVARQAVRRHAQRAKEEKV